MLTIGLEGARTITEASASARSTSGVGRACSMPAKWTGRTVSRWRASHEIVLKRERTVRCLDDRPDRLIGHRQDASGNTERGGEFGSDLRQAGTLS
jgi:hypothetical protein